MAGTSPQNQLQQQPQNQPQRRSQSQPQHSWDGLYDEHPVNEQLSDKSGSQSPFGDDLTFPLAAEELYYRHPGPDNRPHLAGE
jgi:hypothetical protein